MGAQGQQGGGLRPAFASPPSIEAVFIPLCPSQMPPVSLHPTAHTWASGQGAAQLPRPAWMPIREPADPSHGLAHQLLPRPPH